MSKSSPNARPLESVSASATLDQQLDTLKSTLTFRALEPRIAFDAAIVPTLDAAPAPDAPAAADATVQADHSDATPASTPGAETESVAAAYNQLAGAIDSAASDLSHAIVFVDARVGDVAGPLIARYPGAEIVLITMETSGLEQMAAHLAGRTDIEAIHVVSHGDVGTVRLGSDVLTTSTLEAHGNALSAIGQSLTAGGDILLYGCDIASGTAGRTFIDNLARLTSADVAASSDDTGSAQLGGNWALEQSTGAVEAHSIGAPEWDGLLASLNINASADPVTSGGTGLGSRALWANAGSLGGVAIDVRATVISATAGAQVTWDTTGNDLRLMLNSGDVTVKWEIFKSGMNQTIIAAGDPNFSIRDLDGAGGKANTIEAVSARQDGLTSYAVASPTNLIVSTANNQVRADGTQSQNGEVNSQITFNWTNVSSWEVTYIAKAGQGTRFFDHDGNGDFAFVTPVVITVPKLDLDLNDTKTSSGATGYETTFAENAAAIRIADIDTKITNGGTALQSALIVLSNAKLGDQLTVVAGGLPSGITAAFDTSVSGQIKLTLSGSAPPGDYETAIKAIRFSNTSEAPDTADRTINVSVNNGAVFGNVATSLIHVLGVNDAPVLSPGTVTLAEDTTYAFKVADFPMTDVDSGTLQSIRVNSLPGAGTLKLNGTAVTAGQIIAVADITSGKLTFSPFANQNGNTYAQFNYSISDGGIFDPPSVSSTFNSSGDTDGWTYRAYDGAGVSPLSHSDNHFAYDASGVATLISGDVTKSPTRTAGASSPTADGFVGSYDLGPGTGYFVAPAKFIGNKSGAYGATLSYDFIDLTGDNAGSFSNPTDITIKSASGDLTIQAGTSTGSWTNISAQLAFGAGWTIGGVAATEQQIRDVLANVTEIRIGFEASSVEAASPQASAERFAIDNVKISGGNSTTMTINVTPVNDTPAITSPASISVTEDVASPLTGIVFADIDAGSSPVTVTLALPSGSLAAISTAAVAVAGSGTGTMTLSGTVSDINAFIAGSAVKYTTPLNATANVTLTATIDDRGNAGADPGLTGTATTEVATKTITLAVTAVNDAPVSGDDVFTTTEDTAATIKVRANDTDVEGDPLTVTAINGTPITAGGAGVPVTGGVVTLNSAGDLIFTPSANYNGAPTFQYTVSDGNGGSSTATVRGTVTAVNDAPTAANDTFTVAEDVVAIIDVRANDGDVDGDTLTVTAVNGLSLTAGGTGVVVGGGTVTLNASGNLVFTPNADYNGAPSFTYTIADGKGTTATAKVTGTVTPVNDNPTPAIDTFVTSEDTPVTIKVLANDIDVDGDPLKITHVAGQPITAGGAGVAVTGGSVTLTSTGELVFTPNADYNGAPSFTYTVADGNGGTAVGTVNGQVKPVNDAPTAGNDTFTTAEDTPITINVRANDGDVDGNAITVTEINGTPVVAGGASVTVAGGVVTLNASGDLVFTPAADFNGKPSFTYTLSDGNGATTKATVTGTVTPLNDAPVATDDTFTTTEDTPVQIKVLGNDNDIDGDKLTVTKVAGVSITAGGPGVTVAGGVVTLDASGVLTFTPNADYNGAPTFTYTVADPSGAAVNGTVSGTVTPVNDGPVANSDAGGTAENATLAVPQATGVLANDTDIDGNTLTVSAVGGSVTGVGTPVAGTNGGTFTISADGSYVFNPGTAFDQLAPGVQVTTSIVYAVSDGNGGTAKATLTVTVTGQNDGPIAANDAAKTDENTAINVTAAAGLLVNDKDIDGGTLRVSHINGAAFTSNTSVAGSAGGTFTINSDGSYSFDPGTTFDTLAAGQVATTSIMYTVSDGQGGTTTATLTVTVIGLNDGAVAVDDQNSVDENAILSVGPKGGVLVNDRDPEGDPLTVVAVNGDKAGIGQAIRGSDGGTFVLNSDGSYSFDPGSDFDKLPVGASSKTAITYMVSDGNGGTATATLVVIVNGTNDAPLATADTAATSENAPLAVAADGGLIVNDTDADGGVLAISAINGAAANIGSAVGGSAGGTFTVKADGSYAFEPGKDFDYLAPGQTATTSILYQVSDGRGGADVALLTVTVTGSNDGPVTLDDKGSTDEDTPLVVTASAGVLANDSDVDRGALKVSAVNGAAGGVGTAVAGSNGGTFNINADGSYTFSPGTAFDYLAPGQSVVSTIKYTVSDGQGGTAVATLSVTVVGRNDGPVARNDAAATTENSSIAIAAAGGVIGNDTDADGDLLKVSAVNGAAGGVGAPVTGSNGGSFTLKPDGAYGFDPGTAFDDLAPGATRTTSVNYTISDGRGGTSIATLTVTVTGQNDGPVAANDAGSTGENAVLNVGAATGVLVNDSDIDRGNLTVSAVNGASSGVNTSVTGSNGGTFVLKADGSYTFDPGTAFDALAPGQTATSSIVYTVSDGQGGTAPATLTVTITGTNDNPIATVDRATTTENTVVKVAAIDGALKNDSDIDRGTLAVAAVNGVAIDVGRNVVGSAGGTFKLNGDGSYTFDPGTAFDNLKSGETRTTTIAYTVTDGHGGTAVSTVEVTVVGVNDAPTVRNILNRTGVDSVNGSYSVAGFFTDVEGDAMTFSATGLPPGLSISSAGQISGTFTADASQGGPAANGVYTINVNANDGNGGVTSRAFTWSVANPVPVAVDDTGATDQNTVVTGNVVTNDTDADRDPLVVGGVSGATSLIGATVSGSSGGTFVIKADGTYTFDPGTAFISLKAGETKSTSITYTVSDGNGGTDTAALVVTVTGVNDAPIGKPLGNLMHLDSQAVSVNLGAGFADPDGTALSFSAAGLPAGLSMDPATGVVTGTITHDASQVGTHAVTVTASDGTITTSRTFNWTVTNPAPVAVADSLTVAEDSTPTNISVLANDADADGDTLTVTGATAGHGTVTLNGDGTISYKPDADFNGQDTITYTISDGNGGTSVATVAVTVTAGNDAPEGPALPNLSNRDNTAVAIGLGLNFSDRDGDTLSYTATGLPTGLSMNPVTGAITGTIDPNASGGTGTQDYAVSVDIADGKGGVITRTFTWTISNVWPVAEQDTVAIAEDSGPVDIDVLVNDHDVDGDTLNISTRPGDGPTAAYGTVTVVDGMVRYTPPANFHGTDVITYTVTDGNGGYSTANVIVTVTPENDAPTATALSNVRSLDADMVSIAVSQHFADIDGDALSYTASGLPAGLAMSSNGTITGTIDHSASQHGGASDGIYTVTVTADDGHGAIVSKTFTWSVTNPTPTAYDDTPVTTNEDTAVIVDVLSNDSDPDGDAKTVVRASAGNGTVTINPDGTLTYTPKADFNGDDVITYTMTDSEGGTSSATVKVTVTPVNDAPVAGALTNLRHFDADAIDVSVAGAFADIDNNPLTFTATGLPTGLSINNAGVITGTIDKSASGASGAKDYTVRISVSDGNGGTAFRDFVWHVDNRAPDALADTGETSENATTDGNVLTNDTDPDLDPKLVATVNGDAAKVGAGVVGTNGGTFKIEAGGVYTFDAGTDFDALGVGETRTTSVTYRMVDDNGGFADATVTITVTGVNDAPLVKAAVPAQASNDSEKIALNVATSFKDLEGDTLIYAAAGLPPGLTINPETGMISGIIKRDASQSGPYLVTLTVSDGNGGVATTTFNWDVTNPGPDAQDDRFATTENAVVKGALLNDNGNGSDADPDGDPLVVSAVNGTAAKVGTAVGGSNGGSFTVNADGTFTFDPGSDFDNLAAGATRTTTVTYTISDGNGGVDTATATVTVTGTNDAPVAGALANRADVDNANITLNAAPAFSDIDTAALTYTADNLPPGLSINAATGEITGTIDKSASVGGPYLVTVTADDGKGGSASVTFNWSVINPSPTAAGDKPAPSGENTIVTGNVLGNDTDPDQDPLVVAAVNGVAASVGKPVAGSAGGVFTVKADGTYAFDPGTAFDDLAVGQSRMTTIAYTISDGNGGTSTATVIIDVQGVNDAPTVTAIGAQASKDSAAVSLGTAQYFADVDKDTLSFGAAGLPPGLRIDPVTGVISGTLAHDASIRGPANDGVYTVTLTASDGRGGTVTQTFVWVATNPKPTAVADVVAANETSVRSGNVVANDSDPDGDALTVVAVNGVNGQVGAGIRGTHGGTFVINANGSYVFDPGQDFTGLPVGTVIETAVTYTVGDGNGGFATARVTVRVVVESSISNGDLVGSGFGGIDPQPSPVSSDPLTVDGAVLDAVNGVPDSLTIAGSLTADGTVLSAANAFGKLGGIGTFKPGQPVITSEVQRLQRLDDLKSLGSRPRPGEPWDIKGLTGFSIRFDLPGGLTSAAEREQLVVESMVRERVLILQLRGDHLGQMHDFVDFTVSLADGRPLPAWLDQVSQGVLMGEWPVNVEVVELRIVGRLSDGLEVTRNVSIQTTTGEIQPLREPGEIIQQTPLPPMFTDQLKAQPMLSPAEIDSLNKLLQDALP